VDKTYGIVNISNRLVHIRTKSRQGWPGSSRQGAPRKIADPSPPIGRALKRDGEYSVGLGTTTWSVAGVAISSTAAPATTTCYSGNGVDGTVGDDFVSGGPGTGDHCIADSADEIDFATCETAIF